MQAVYVLRDQPEAIEAPFHLDERSMRWIGKFAGDDLAPPVVPFPYQARVSRKCFRCSQVLGPEVPPQAVCSPEGRHPAVGGDAGSREHSDRAGFREPGSYLLNAGLARHEHPWHSCLDATVVTPVGML